jgi:hypothetical protein
MDRINNGLLPRESIKTRQRRNTRIAEIEYIDDGKELEEE